MTFFSVVTCSLVYLLLYRNTIGLKLYATLLYTIKFEDMIVITTEILKMDFGLNHI